MRWLLALVFGTAPLAPTATVPGFLDAPRLMQLCSAIGPDAQPARTLCLGYIVGAADQLLMRQSPDNPSVCLPRGTTPDQLLEAVMRQRQWSVSTAPTGASDFIRFALEQAYPCPARRDAP